MVSFKASEGHVIQLLFIGFLAVVWWVALWGLIDEGFQMASQKTGLHVRTLYVVVLIALTGLFLAYPHLLSGI